MIAAVWFGISRIAQLHLIFNTNLGVAGQSQNKQTGGEASGQNLIGCEAHGGILWGRQERCEKMSWNFRSSRRRPDRSFDFEMDEASQHGSKAQNFWSRFGSALAFRHGFNRLPILQLGISYSPPGSPIFQSQPAFGGNVQMALPIHGNGGTYYGDEIAR